MILARILGAVLLALVTVAGGALLARRVLSTPPGRRWLVLDAGLYGLLAVVDVGVYVLTGGGFFWPAFSLIGLALVLGAHVWWTSTRPDPAERALRGRMETLAQTRTAVLDARSDELARVERDLHDGTQARLVSLRLSLGMAEDLVRTDPEAAVRMLAEARTSAGTAIDELRAVMQGIRPGVLADRGLVEAVRALGYDLPVPVTVTGTAPPLSTAAEQAAYFVVAECLANVVKHSGATTATVTFAVDGDLRVTVVDDGHGGADPASGTGLRGVAGRLAPFDGTLDVSSPVGGPTSIVVRLPYSGNSSGSASEIA